MRRNRLGIAALALALLAAAACGSQLDAEQLRESDQLGAPTLAGGRQAGNGTEADSAVGASSSTTIAAGGAAASTTGADHTAPPGAGGSAAPAGGNGGATDVGVTATTITVGSIATLTGPVPGLFKSAVQGTQACAARINSKGGIYGRELKVAVGDDQANENQMRAQATKLASSVVAFVGSFSLFDGAIIPPAQQAGIPDIGTALQAARSQSPINFSPQPTPPGWGTGGLSYLKAKYPEASQHVGFLEADAASAQNEGIKAVLRKLGMKIVYDQTYGATTTDFTAQVFRMQSAGVRMLVMSGEQGGYSQVIKAVRQQGLQLDVFNPVSNAYDPGYIEAAGAAAEGTTVYSNLSMYRGEDAAAVPEVAEYNRWLDRIDPDAKADTFGVYGWASCLLFAQAAQAAGPNLTRRALFEQLAKITTFDANGLFAKTNPAQKGPPTCYIVLRVTNGRWQRTDTPTTGFRCDGDYLRT